MPSTVQHDFLDPPKASSVEFSGLRAEVASLRAQLATLANTCEALGERVSFWRSQATAAQRRKSELYSLLMSMRVQIDQAFGDHKPEEAT